MWHSRNHPHRVLFSRCVKNLTWLPAMSELDRAAAAGKTHSRKIYLSLAILLFGASPPCTHSFRFLRDNANPSPSLPPPSPALSPPSLAALPLTLGLYPPPHLSPLSLPSSRLPPLPSLNPLPVTSRSPRPSRRGPGHRHRRAAQRQRSPHPPRRSVCVCARARLTRLA
jgi:hypothetical protein